MAIRFGMERDEAWEVLDLPPDAQEDQIESQFREKVTEKHPDNGGSKEAFSRLLEARNTLLDAQGELDLAKSTSLLDQSTLPIRYEQNKRQTEKTVNRIRRKNTSRYRRRMQVLKVLGGLFGFFSALASFFSFFGSQVQSSLLIQFNELFTTVRGQVLLLLTVSLLFMIGLMYWVFSVRVRNIEMAITETEEALDQKPNIIEILGELDLQLQNGKVKQSELERAIDDWAEGESHEQNPLFSPRSLFGVMSPELRLKDIAGKIGSADFNRIFLRKCVEHGLIEEQVNAKEDDWGVRYKLTVSS